MKCIRACFAGITLAFIFCGPARSESAKGLFSGKTIHFIAGFEAGGPYDFYTRLIARYMAPHLPGKPTVIVDNMPGAGSVIAANYLYNVAPRDGTAMGILSPTIGIGQVLQDVPGLRYDVRNMTWIGRIVPNVEVAFTWRTSNYRSIDDAQRSEVTTAGTGPTSSSVVFPKLMNALIGTKYKLVRGYTGPASAMLALQKGEVSQVAMIWSGIKAGYANFLADKSIIPVLQFSEERYSELSDVPTVVEYAKTEQQRDIFRLFASGAELGVSLVAPPGLSFETTNALRLAFESAMEEPGLAEQLKRAQSLPDPLSGQELQRRVLKPFAPSPELVDESKAILARPN